MSRRGKAGNQITNIVFPDKISAREMEIIIANGLLEFEKQKKQREDAEKASRRKEWQDAIGVKDYSEVKKPMKWLLQFFNAIKVLWKICTIPEKHIKGDGATFGIIQTMLGAVFAILNIVFLVLSLIAFFLSLMLFVKISWNIAFAAFSLGILALLFSRAFRIASFEVINMEDRNYLFGLFTCVVSTISVIVAVIALFAVRG